MSAGEFMTCKLCEVFGGNMGPGKTSVNIFFFAVELSMLLRFSLTLSAAFLALLSLSNRLFGISIILLHIVFTRAD